MTPVFVYRVGNQFICREIGDDVNLPTSKLIASLDAKYWIQHLLNTNTQGRLQILREIEEENHDL